MLRFNNEAINKTIIQINHDHIHSLSRVRNAVLRRYYPPRRWRGWQLLGSAHPSPSSRPADQSPPAISISKVPPRGTTNEEAVRGRSLRSQKVEDAVYRLVVWHLSLWVAETSTGSCWNSVLRVTEVYSDRKCSRGLTLGDRRCARRVLVSSSEKGATVSTRWLLGLYFRDIPSRVSFNTNFYKLWFAFYFA